MFGSRFGGARGRAGALRALVLGATVATSSLVGVGGARTAGATGALQTIALESVQSGRVTLGPLASRSQRKPVTIAGIGPYTMTGLDSRSGQNYTFVTDANYSPATPAYQSESDERNASLTTSNATGVTFGSRSGVTEMRSSGNCSGPNDFDGKTTYCGVFGPQVYSEPFRAGVGQSVAFNWAAVRQSDDYEIYAYLVEVNETSPGVFDYGTEASHQLLAYGRGRNQSWITASGEVPHSGSYRFRFVNGTFDGTGGLAVGSVMYVDGVVRVGLSNPITFAQPSDRLLADGDVALSATSVSPGGPVAYTSITPSTCTVSGSTVTPVAAGTCSVIADHPGDGIDYVPASSVTRSFKILAAATAPSNSGVPLIQGGTTDGSIITATPGTWGDGGSPITSTTGTFLSDGSPISGVTGSSCRLVESPGSTLTYRVTKTNAVGSTTVTSAARPGFTCAPAIAPLFDPAVTLELKAGSATSTTGLATGAPAPTFAVSAGQLPAGLTLDPATGTISGTPTTAGPYDVTISATNGVAPAATKRFTGTVAPRDVPAQLGDTTTVAGQLGASQVGRRLDARLTATGTPAPTFAVSAGQLPAGLTLDPATGTISGTPTTAGPYDVTISATNGVAPAATKRFTGTVAPRDVPAQLGDTTTVAGQLGASQVGRRLDARLTATGTPAPTFAVSAGQLPAGLTLDPATGTISGTPTTAGPYDVTISATNGVAPAATKRFTGTVAPRDVPAPPPVPKLVVTPPGRGAGATMTVATGGFEPGSTVRITVAGRTTTVTAGPTGDIDVDVPTPDDVEDFDIDIAGVSSTDGAVEMRRSVVTDFTGQIAVVPVDAGFTATDPLRVVDTRRGARLEAGETLRIPVDPSWDLPAGAEAFVLNVVAVRPEGPGFLTVHPCDDDRPTSSVLNYGREQTVSNAVIVDGSVDEDICVYTDAATHLVVDLDGAFGGQSDERLVALPPSRLVDTRTSTKVEAGGILEVQVAGEGSAPAGTVAALLNIAVAQPSADGFITVFPCTDDVPVASNVNYRADRVTSNLAFTELSDDGTVCLYTSAAAHLVVDLDGAVGSGEDTNLVTGTITRLLDTRTTTKAGAGETIVLEIGGENGISTARAGALNVTVVQPEERGYVTIYPCAEGRPVVSNLNYEPGSTVANHVAAALDTDGLSCIYTSGAAHIVVDVEGVYI